MKYNWREDIQVIINNGNCNPARRLEAEIESMEYKLMHSFGAGFFLDSIGK